MSKQTILFVDDEANVLKALKRLMVGTDYKILLAESGTEGLKLFEEHKIGLVISDYRMPGMNGVQFLSEVKNNHPKTIRIILSGFADIEAILEAVNTGHIYKFLSKPWNDQELLTTIKRSFEHFELEQDHTSVLKELQDTNEELKKITKSLEDKIEERTRDLLVRNSALQVSHNILNSLPFGVIGINIDGTIVYLNTAATVFFPSTELQLGNHLNRVVSNEILEMFETSVANNIQVSTIVNDNPNIIYTCQPIREDAGVVLTIVKNQIFKDNQYSVPVNRG